MRVGELCARAILNTTRGHFRHTHILRISKACAQYSSRTTAAAAAAVQHKSTSHTRVQTNACVPPFQLEGFQVDHIPNGNLVVHPGMCENALIPTPLVSGTMVHTKLFVPRTFCSKAQHNLISSPCHTPRDFSRCSDNLQSSTCSPTTAVKQTSRGPRTSFVLLSAHVRLSFSSLVKHVNDRPRRRKISSSRKRLSSHAGTPGALSSCL